MRINSFKGFLGILFLAFGCTSPPVQPKGVTARDWMNDYMKSPDGSIWQVQATWNEEDQIVFQGQTLTGDQLRAKVIEDGIDKGSAIRIAVEPGVAFPKDEWMAFREAGFLATAFLLPEPEHWLKDR